MTYCKISKQTYVTRKTSLFENVVRVYPIETNREGGGGVQRQSGGDVFFPQTYIRYEELTPRIASRGWGGIGIPPAC